MKEIKLLESLTGKKVKLKENYMPADYWDDYKESGSDILAYDFVKNPELWITEQNDTDFSDGSPLSSSAIEEIKKRSIKLFRNIWIR